jgi:hypothetical protein
MSKQWLGVVVVALGLLALAIPSMQGADVGVSVTAEEASTVHGACSWFKPDLIPMCIVPCWQGIDVDTAFGPLPVVHNVRFNCGCGSWRNYNAYGCS